MRKSETFKIPDLNLLLEVIKNESGYIQRTRIKKIKKSNSSNSFKTLKKSGGDTGLDISKIDQLTPFQIKVYKVLKKVPAGKVLTYKELAEKMGSPKAARAIGSAMRRNPVPYLVPCHRVVRADGVIGMFSAEGGPATKALLLAHEGIKLSQSGRILS